MLPAKKFFYVCAGLFLLALSYQLGVRKAEAQSGSRFACAAVDYYGTNLVAAVIGRTYYNCGGAIGPAIPGSDVVIACSGFWGGDGATVVLANGDVYHLDPSQENWILDCQIAAGVVNVEKHTLGQLKQRFR